MIKHLRHAKTIAGFLLVISGIILLARTSLLGRPEAPPALFALWYLLPALTIQLLQGGMRPYLGTLGILIILGVLVGAALFLPDDPFLGDSPMIILLLLLLYAPPAAFVLVGTSMVRAGYFPRFWGYAVALTALALTTLPLLLQIPNHAFRIPLALVLILLGIREAIPKEPSAAASTRG
jgi:hypothetical protein